jgi:competence protein ComEA
MSSVAPTPPSQPHSTWPDATRLAIAFLLGGLTVALLGRYGSLFARPTPTQLNRPALVTGVDLNRADKAELLQLPQIGERRADEIIAARERNGSFKSPDDLRSAKGIGPSRQQSLRPYVRTDGEEQFVRDTQPKRSSSTSGVDSKPAQTHTSKKEPLAEPIDVNRADAGELQKLPGVGPVMASRIIAERAKAPFRSAEDLRRVSGIGPKTLEKLRPFVRFDSDDEKQIHKTE